MSADFSPSEVLGRAIGDPEPLARMGADWACERCACGGFVWAPRSNPGPSVEAHNAQPCHRRWAARFEADQR